jgi:type VI protein secretion system component VasK
MTASAAKTIFAVSCIVCLLAIATGAILEVLRQKRGESLLRPGQFRLRMFSALIWLIALGSLAYAVAFLWPQKGDLVQARKFISLISGALTLIFIAVLLLAYDMWQLARARKINEAQFQRHLAELAREEILKAQHGRDEANASEAGGTS